MKILAAVLGGFALLPAVVSAQENARSVRLVTNRAAVQDCGEMLAVVKDDDVDDLKKKAAKKGGTHALIAGHGVLSGADPLQNPFFRDRQVVVAEVYRCPEGVAQASAPEAVAREAASIRVLEERIRVLEDRVNALERAR